jgi:hypothetical protein
MAYDAQMARQGAGSDALDPRADADGRHSAGDALFLAVPGTIVAPRVSNRAVTQRGARRSDGLGYSAAAMRPLIRLVLACAVTASVACFSERLAPPTFRYRCTSDMDCNEPEACIRGLCQIPCTQATFREDCPSAGSYAACFNGTCSNLCTIGEDHCPDPQTCIDLPIDTSAAGGGGPFGGAQPTGPLGICGVECVPGDDVCPEGEACLQGFCVQSCMFDIDCQDGFACIAGLCLPEELDTRPETGGLETGETTGGPADETTEGPAEETGPGDDTTTGGAR